MLPWYDLRSWLGVKSQLSIYTICSTVMQCLPCILNALRLLWPYVTSSCILVLTPSLLIYDTSRSEWPEARMAGALGVSLSDPTCGVLQVHRKWGSNLYPPTGTCWVKYIAGPLVPQKCQESISQLYVGLCHDHWSSDHVLKSTLKVNQVKRIECIGSTKIKS